MKIVPLSEGTFTVDKTKMFVPFNEEQDRLQHRPVGSLLVEIQPFVVITPKDVLLLDTGLGFEKNDVLQLHQNLMDNGIKPTDVTKVLLSHLHKDHAGGIGRRVSSGDWQLNFPSAKYYLQERELNAALQKGAPSFNSDELEVLMRSENIGLLKEDRGMIGAEISFELTAAHSRYHQVFWIKSQGDTVFFGGDDAPQLQQMKHRFVTKYDYDGKKTMELRRQWWIQGEKEKWTFLFYHDVKNAVYSFK